MLDRTNGPGASSPEIIDLPPVRVTTLKSQDLNLFLFNQGRQDVCKIELVYPGGKQTERVKGASMFTSKMLFEGSAHMSASQINQFFDLYGAFIDSTSTLDDNQVTLYCQTEHLSKLLPELVRIIRSPLFPTDELVRLKERQIQQIRINEGKSQFWSTKLLRKSLFGADQPYGHVLSVEDVERIESPLLSEFHQNNISGSLPDIFVSGSFNESELQSTLESSFDSLDLSYNAPKRQNIKIGNSKVVAKTLENSQQASVKIGLPMVNRDHQDYAGISILNKYLGGFFGSRLMKVIREEKGLTYGMHSGIMHLLNTSFLQISGDVKLGAATEVVDLIKEEIDHLSHKLITDEDLLTVKNYMVGEFQNEVNTTFDLATKHKMLYYSKLPEDWYKNYFESIMELSPEMLIEIGQRHFLLDELHIVTVE